MRLYWLAAWTAATVLSGVLAGAYPAWRLGGGQGLTAMAWAAVVAAIAFGVGLVVFALWVNRSRHRRDSRAVGMSFLLTGPVRMIATLGLAAAVWWLGDLPARPLFVWVGVFYLLFLAAEVLWLTGLLRAIA